MGVVLIESGRGLENFARAMLQQNPPPASATTDGPTSATHGQAAYWASSVQCNTSHLTEQDIKGSSLNFGCVYSTGTGTQLRVPTPYICMGSSHACAIVQLAVSRERCGKRASKPNGKNLYPS